MEYPSLTIKGNQLQYPKQPFQLTLIHKNLQALAEKPDFKLYRVESGKYNQVKDLQLNLISKAAYQQDTLFVDLGVLPVGKYSFSCLSKDSLENGTTKDGSDIQINNTFDFTVSSLIALSRNSAKDEYEILVVDRMTGKPVKDATVKIYTIESPNKDANQVLTTMIKTDALGLAVYNDKTVSTDQYRYNIATYKICLLYTSDAADE